MSKITIDNEDVATLREVFHLALIQSEAVVKESADWLDSDELDDAEMTRVRGEHNAVVSLMSRIDAMLPEGF